MPEEKKTIMSLHWQETDDDSLLLEFVSNDLRFGIVIENDLTESSWYYVNKAQETAGCVLPDDLISALANRLTKHVANQLRCEYCDTILWETPIYCDAECEKAAGN